MVIKNIHLKFIILSKFILKSPVVSIQAFSWPTLGDLVIAYDMTFLPRDLLQVRYNRCVLRIKGLAGHSSALCLSSVSLPSVFLPTLAPFSALMALLLSVCLFTWPLACLHHFVGPHSSPFPQ